MQRVQRCCYDRAAQTIVAPTLILLDYSKLVQTVPPCGFSTYTVRTHSQVTQINLDKCLVFLKKFIVEI